MAASRHKSAMSAPVYPWHRSASAFKTTSLLSGMRCVCCLKIAWRCAREGGGTRISVSSRPGRRNAGSIAFGLFVAAITLQGILTVHGDALAMDTVTSAVELPAKVLVTDGQSRT